jgi:hypothetical protein
MVIPTAFLKQKQKTKKEKRKKTEKEFLKNHRNEGDEALRELSGSESSTVWKQQSWRKCSEFEDLAKSLSDHR